MRGWHLSLSTSSGVLGSTLFIVVSETHRALLIAQKSASLFSAGSGRTLSMSTVSGTKTSALLFAGFEVENTVFDCAILEVRTQTVTTWNKSLFFISRLRNKQKVLLWSTLKAQNTDSAPAR